jgi:hypothetical protein
MNKQLEEKFKANPRLRELWDSMPPFKPKPKTQVVTELDGKIAGAVQANPESVKVRVTARGADGVAVLDAPRPANVEVVEVDAAGRPKLTKRYDPTTNGWDWIEHRDGYSAPSGGGVVSAYNPLDALDAGKD